MEILEPEPSRGLATPSAGFIERHGLTKREAEVLPLLTRRLSYRQIGERLFISVGTVRTHLIHIYQKTGASSRLELLQVLQRQEGGDQRPREGVPQPPSRPSR